MIISSPKDAAKIKAGEQFTVDVPGLGPMEDGETFEDFTKREAEARKAVDEIFAAVDAALAPKVAETPTRIQSRFIGVIRDNDPDTARKILKMADVRALATEMGIETRDKSELALITEIKSASERKE